MDPKVNGMMQRYWGWLIAAYLFLGGMGAGAYAFAAINTFMGKIAAPATTVGLWLGFPALLVGSILLLADLGSPTRAFFAGAKPGTSWMARGFWIISLFMVIAFIHLVYVYFGASRTEPSGLEHTIAAVGLLFAILTMAYTGILLGAAKGIPLWRTGVVPVVFTVSGLVTGHFAIIIGVAMVFPAQLAEGALRIMALEAVVLVVVEVLTILFFLQGAYKLPDSRESAERMLRRGSFIFGYFVLGLGVPLVVMLYLLFGSGTEQSTVVSLAFASGVLGLLGGLILRHAVLVCGALPTLNMTGYQFRRIPRPKEPRAHIGKVPPH